MMRIDDVKVLYGLACFSLCLIIVSPTIATFVSFPSGEPFSEIWVLGSGHMLEGYPFDVENGAKEQVFVGVGNHLGRSAYYVVYVKLRNQTQALPNSTISEPSPLAPLYEFRAVVADGETWEEPFAFSFLEASHFGDLFAVKKISINDQVFTVEYPCVWDSENNGFFYQLFFELWIYDDDISGSRYHNRFAGIWLNMTV